MILLATIGRSAVLRIIHADVVIRKHVGDFESQREDGKRLARDV